MNRSTAGESMERSVRQVSNNTIHTKPTRWPYGGICGLILPPGVDSYRNLTGGGQGVGCFISLRAQTAHNTKTFETEW